MSELPPATYRPFTEADIAAAAYVRKAALEQLAEERNVTMESWQPFEQTLLQHLLRTDPDCAWTAEVNGLFVGYAMGFVRGDIWFLSQLFVQPEVHTSGAGHGLLERSVEAGRARGARIISVVSSPSAAAHALYMRAGMFATGVLYRISGPVAALLALPEPDASRKAVVDCSGWQDRIADLDRVVWGAERPVDHAAYLRGAFAPEGGQSFALTRGADFLGYGYAAANGVVGPVAAYDAEDVLLLLRTAGEWLHGRDLEEAVLQIPSMNATALAPLLRSGWRLGRWTYLLTSAPFGQFDRYVAANGTML